MCADVLVSLRPATAEDAKSIVELIGHAFGPTAHLLDPKPSALSETADAVVAMLAKNHGLVIELNKRIVATAWFKPQSDGALYVGRLAVHPEAQGQGLARRLMLAGEALAAELGHDRLTLNYRLALPRNRRLFEGLGYREIDRRAHSGYATPTFAVMEKHLSPQPSPKGDCPE